MKICIDIWNCVVQFLDVPTQLEVRCLNKFLLNNLFLNFNSHTGKLTDAILSRYTRVASLYLCNNIDVTNINHLHGLTNLSVCERSVLKYDGIEHLKKLENIDLRWNNAITKIPYIPTIKEINLAGNSTIKDDDIQIFDLKKLDISCNPNISKISHFKNLEYLAVRFYCNVSIEEINKCENLKVLDIRFNEKFKTFASMIMATMRIIS